MAGPLSIRSEFSDGWRVYLYVLLEISPNLPSTQPYSFGKSVLAETSGAGAPFPHCGAAHGASGGPRAGPEFLSRATLHSVRPVTLPTLRFVPIFPQRLKSSVDFTALHLVHVLTAVPSISYTHQTPLRFD